ncbi:hypothetical protein [Thermococcus gammatolerans]|nr:hypothetical protein [Thermococcus gammatolerans]
MRSFLAFLLVFLLSFLAYNAYTYHQLSSAEGAYKLAGIPSSEKLIAVYHDENFWQFATYNPKARELKVYYVGQDFPLLFRIKKTKTVKTPLNYSPLALDLKLLEKAPKETPALLFAGKWYTKENPPEFPTVEQILQQYNNKTMRRLSAYYAEKELWIGAITMQTGDAIYGGIGPGRILVIPSLKSYMEKPFVWRVEIPAGGDKSQHIVYYPDGITIKGYGEVVLPKAFVIEKWVLEKSLNATLKALAKPTPISGSARSFVDLTISCWDSNSIEWSIMYITRYWPGISMQNKIPEGYVLSDYGQTSGKCQIIRTANSQG